MDRLQVYLLAVQVSRNDSFTHLHLLPSGRVWYQWFCGCKANHYPGGK